MPKENRFAGLGEAMQSEPSNDDSERRDEAEQQDEAEQDADGTEVDSTSADAVSMADENQGSEDRETKSSGENDDDAATSERPVAEATPEAEVGAEAGADEKENEGGGTGDEEDGTSDEEEGTGDRRDGAGDESKVEDGENGPAFEFEATTAKSIYVREETLERLDDAEFEVESVLRREHDIRDLTGREFHDALIHVAATYVDEIADVVVERREERESLD
ncbi:hypothetical protein [Haloferax sp. YSSS75]|uniref:hypothetical protein n=1 Tax=Haloferax sp. YSSS75 TaxID=3388564 RepID=UPI00398D4522